MGQQFILCGGIGWCMEILWTGIHALCRGEAALTGRSSLWMFPIYGFAAVIGPVSRRLKKIPVFFRGCIYMTGIFFVEFSTGTLLKSHFACPWDYSHVPFNYKGLIRLDYAPVWFATGLFFEKILSKNLEKTA